MTVTEGDSWGQHTLAEKQSIAGLMLISHNEREAQTVGVLKVSCGVFDLWLEWMEYFFMESVTVEDRHARRWRNTHFNISCNITFVS